MAVAKGKKGGHEMKKPGASSPVNVNGATKAPARSKSMEHCSNLLKPVVPQMGTGGIKS